MTTAQAHKKDLNPFNYDNVFIWWYQPWMGTSNSAVKLQYFWLDTLNDAMRHEIEFLSAMTASYSKLTDCMLGREGIQTPFSMMAGYHDMARDMTEATFKRMQKVTEFSDDFKERLWSEI
ncbi:MAG: hypothetical protein EA345_16150 [Halomonas sp.]|nr:hypothetical protein [Halomonas sp.]TVP44011.1 MAG: hypothetical protein EA345_16150 [Halomonas sp.]